MRAFSPALTALGLLRRARRLRTATPHAADAAAAGDLYERSGSGAASSCPRTRTAPARLPTTCRRWTRRRSRCASGTGRTCCGASNAIARERLSTAEQLNYDIYRQQLAVLIANQRFRDFEMPANSDTTFWTDIGYTARRPFRTLTDYQHWIAQMRDIPRYFHEQMDEMRAGMRARFHPAAHHHGGARYLDHRGHRGDPGSEPLLYALPGDARRPAGEAGEPAAAGDHGHPRGGAAGVRRAAEIHAHRVRARACAPRSRRRTCPMAPTTTAPRSASSPPSTWIRQAIHALGSPRCSGCTRRCSLPCTRPASAATSRRSSSSCAATRASMRARPRSC